MYYIGIDIAKLKHTCAVVSSSGMLVKKSFYFDNSHFGFASLKSIIDSLDSSNIKIGFESTGHYSANLSQFLKNNRFPFCELNPYLVKKFSASLSTIYLKTSFNILAKANSLKSIANMSSINSPILSIPGISYLTAASILAEIDNIDRFSNYRFLIAYAGLDNSVYQSGNSLHLGRISKRGSIYLRTALFKASVSITHHSKLFASYYFKKKLDGKHRTLALICVSRKLLRIIHHLLTNNVSFNDNLI